MPPYFIPAASFKMPTSTFVLRSSKNNHRMRYTYHPHQGILGYANSSIAIIANANDTQENAILKTFKSAFTSFVMSYDYMVKLLCLFIYDPIYVITIHMFCTIYKFVDIKLWFFFV